MGLGLGFNHVRRHGVNEVEDTNPQMIEIPPGAKLTHLSFGQYHTGAVSDGGKAFMCGNNVDGKLGFGEYPDACSTLTELTISRHRKTQKIVFIDCGKNHTVAINDKGRVLMW